MENPMGTFAVLMPTGFKTYIWDLWFHLESVSNICYVCVIRQIALNDKIGAFIGSFKLRLDLTNLDKYLSFFLMVKDFQVSTNKSNHL